MSDQKLLYNDNPYKKKHDARIIGKSTEFGLKIDEPIFYPRGGGQPGDSGTILVNGNHIKVNDILINGVAHCLLGQWSLIVVAWRCIAGVICVTLNSVQINF